ncbi:MAG: sulfatase [Phycisphaeraceae bacterium]
MNHQPNFLFLFPDQWRWDWLGCHDGSDSPYGKVPVRTPHIDALAARGVRFTQCRTNSPVCAPARACLARGVCYERCGVPSNGFNTPVDSDTIFRRLRDAGYRTACTGKTDLQKHGYHKGLDGWTPAIGQLGFIESANQCGKWDAVNSGAKRPADPYMASLHASGWVSKHLEDYQQRQADRKAGTLATYPSPLPRAHCTDDFCGQQALDMLHRWPTQPAGEDAYPWMLWVNFPGPHEPFDPPAELMHRYDGVDFPPPVAVPNDASPQDHPQLRRNYAAMCEGIDEWVGRLLAAVEARGELDNTVVIFASDHGEMLGDHGRWYKAVPHEGSVHVPLIAAGPGIPKGETRDDLAELIDVGATLLAAAGLEVPDTFDARPLSIHGGQPRETQVSALGDWRMVCDGRWKLVQREGQPDELYDLEHDPAESTNVAGEHTDEIARLASASPQA